MGTAAHAFTLLHDSEEAAFRSQLDALGSGTTLLVDTYDIEAAVDTAVRLTDGKLGAVRIDSGDLPSVVASVAPSSTASGRRARRSRSRTTSTSTRSPHSALPR